MDKELALKRTLTLPLVTFYGIGGIVGAGIYVLIGEVAGVSGNGVAMAFLLAGVIAGLTGATYAELSSRFPKSAGAALFVDEAFNQPQFSRLIAAMLLFTGVISSSAIAQGFVGYFQLYVPLGDNAVLILLCVLMFGVASWGIKESAWLISIITLIEVGGLLLIIFQTSTLPMSANVSAVFDFSSPGTIVIGSFIAFYAFIGFEDMVNVAEEVKDPHHTMPRGILLAVAVSSLLYMGVAIVAILFVDLDSIAASSSPLTLMVGQNETLIVIISLISMVAIVNGALVQIIMSSRVLYGMAMRKLLPPVFARLNRRTQTPVLNTLLTTLVILALAILFPLVTLAKVTSAMMLFIFVVVNGSLIVIKWRERHGKGFQGFRVPLLIPCFGLVFSLVLLGAQAMLD
jgi:basic amino acid/polyamine antiporter, APA family